MINTLLEIGEVLRIEHPIDTYQYFVETPKTNIEDKRKVQVWSVFVDENFNFNVDNAEEIVGNVGRYFTFRPKTSENDTTYRYICGDIYYSLKKLKNKQKEITYHETSSYRTKKQKIIDENLSKEVSEERNEKTKYRTEGSKDKSCFEITKIEQLSEFTKDNSEIADFRKCFSRNLEKIEDFLYEKALAILNEDEGILEGGIILHFDFNFDENGRSWFERERQVKSIKKAITKFFFDKQNDLYVMNKSLHHAIGSHQEDAQFPEFNRANQFKTRGFSENEAESIFHAVRFVDKYSSYGVRVGDLRISILPRGNINKLTSQAILDFFTSKDTAFSDRNFDEISVAEKSFSKIIKRNSDPLLEKLTENVPESIRQFDLIFVDTSGQAIIDSVELSGVERSFLTHLREKVKSAVFEINSMRNESKVEVSEEFETITIANSFKHILEIPFDDKKTGYDQKKYQAFLLKTLPKVYSNTYYRDPILLNWLVENTELWIRRTSFEKAREHFILTKFDWLFLNKIQIEGENFMKELIDSNSYNIGIKLGELCRPISWKKGSFTATHAGMLTRRVSTVSGLLQFILEVEEIMCRNKLATSERRSLANELVGFVKNLEQKDYDKYFLGFGFFESYFKKLTEADKIVVDESDEQTYEMEDNVENQNPEEKI